MSLINEALKKARQDAAQQEAVRRGLPAAKAPAFTARRGRRWLPRAAVAVAALLLAAAAGAWLAQRAPVRPPAATGAAAPASPVASEPATVAPAAEAEAVPAETPARREEAPTAPPAKPAPATATAPASPAASPAAQPPTATALSQPPPADPETAQTPPATAARAPAPALPQIYSRQATLPDGSTLRLDGIAWSEISPSAVLNGQLVGRGERVAGALVLRIEPDRVVIDAGGRELTIRLR